MGLDPLSWVPLMSALAMYLAKDRPVAPRPNKCQQLAIWIFVICSKHKGASAEYGLACSLLSGWDEAFKLLEPILDEDDFFIRPTNKLTPSLRSRFGQKQNLRMTRSVPTPAAGIPTTAMNPSRAPDGQREARLQRPDQPPTLPVQS